MRRLITFFLISAIYLLVPNNTFADQNFSSAFHINYAISDSGNTHTTINVTLTNKTDNYYVASYKLMLGFSALQNVTAFDAHGKISPQVTNTDNGETVNIPFNSPVVGKGNYQSFTLSFDTNEVASKQGTVWEVNIPGLVNQNDFDSFSVHVDVPSDFGKPVYIKPEQGSDNLDFTKDQLNKSGISIGFGNRQGYTYHLVYHLKNFNLFPATEDIALPPTTNYQDVFLNSLTPKPSNVTMDKDGNWIAHYSLLPSQLITVIATGDIYTYLYPKKGNLTPGDREIYLKQQPFWEVNDPQIQLIAHKLQTPYAIFQYVVNTLNYDFNRVSDTQERLGATRVLKNPNSAVCLEFTDLFIALARAAGIPAREVDGYAYTQNSKERPLSLVKDILHAWPEYYDDTKQSWIMVDPTWQNTTGGVDYFNTLDFDHVAFVIKGVDSSLPVAAGGYKLPGQENEKDIDMNFTNENLTLTPKIDVGFAIPDTFLAGFPISGNIMLKNNSPVLFPAQILNLTTSVLLPLHQQVMSSAIPPFGNEAVGFSYNQTPFLTNFNDHITITLAQSKLSKQINVEFLTRQQLFLGGIILGVIIFGFIIFIIAIKARRLFVLRQ